MNMGQRDRSDQAAICQFLIGHQAKDLASTIEAGNRVGRLEKLEQQTGLSQEELLARLSRELPTAVDKYTPDGRLPAA